MSLQGEENHQQNKRQPTNGKRYFQIIYAIQGYYTKYINNLYNLASK